MRIEFTTVTFYEWTSWELQRKYRLDIFEALASDSINRISTEAHTKQAELLFHIYNWIKQKCFQNASNFFNFSSEFELMEYTVNYLNNGKNLYKVIILTA